MSEKKSNLLKKSLLIIAIFILLSTTIGTTFAYLTSISKEVINNFTYGDIKVSIKESNITENENDYTNSYQLKPGGSIIKDTMVTIESNSEDCWLYIKIDKSPNFDNYMTYDLEEGWLPLENVDNVFYREVSISTNNQDFYILNDNKITVKENVTKSEINSLKAKDYPTFDITAYAVQRDSSQDAIASASRAWNVISSQN